MGILNKKSWIFLTIGISLFLVFLFFGFDFVARAACPTCYNEVTTTTTVYNPGYTCQWYYCLGFCYPSGMSYSSCSGEGYWDGLYLLSCWQSCSGGSTDCGCGGSTSQTTSCVPYSTARNCTSYTTTECSGTSVVSTTTNSCSDYCSNGTYIPPESTYSTSSTDCANQNYWSAPYYYCSGDSVMYDLYYNQYTCSGGACGYAGYTTYTYTAQNCANQNYTETGCQGDSSYVRNVSYTCSGAACVLSSDNTVTTSCTDSWVYGAPFSGCGGADGKQLCTYQTRYYYESVCSVNACTTPTITQTETLTLGCSYQIGQCGVQCLSATDCNDGSACTGDICSSYTCSNLPLCTAGQICDPAIGCITPACSSNADCGISNACITYTCNNPSTPSASCSSTLTSCPSGYCDPGIGCYTPACTSNSECGISNACITYTCNNPSTPSASCSSTSVSCPPGQICDPSIGCYTPPPPNQQPSATNPNETQNPCAWGAIPQVAPGLAINLKWTYFDQDGDPQTAYEIWLDDNSGFPDPKFNNLIEHLALPGPDFSYQLNLADDDNFDWLSQLNWNTPYYWKVRVRDNQDNWSGWSSTDTFTTPLHPYPKVDFTWSPQKPAKNEKVNFKDGTLLYNPVTAINDAPCTSSTCSWLWTMPGQRQYVDGTNQNSQNPIVKFQEFGNGEVTLETTDTDLGLQGSCSRTRTLIPGLPLPKWREVAP